MEKVVVYVDDAAYALQQVASVKRSATAPGQAGEPLHWVLVACAPRMTHRISKWVSHSARESWRAKWSDRLFDQLVPVLQARGDTVTTVLAKGPLSDLTRKLLEEHATERVVDARRPKLAPDGQPAAGQPKPGQNPRWSTPGSAMGLGTLLLLALE